MAMWIMALIPQDANLCWSLDFRHGYACERSALPHPDAGDDFTREFLCLVVDNSLTAMRVARELNRIVESQGCPRMIVSDNGTEFTSTVTLAWQEQCGIDGTTSHRASRCRMAS